MDTKRTSYLDWVELAFTFGLAAVCTWYVYDAYSASSRAKNIILILPVGILSALLACNIIVMKVMKMARARKEQPAAVSPGLKDRTSSKKAWQTLAITVLFALYCVLVDLSGFDVATFIFVLLSLFILQEKSKATLLLYPIIFTFIALKMVAITSYGLPVTFEVMGR